MFTIYHNPRCRKSREGLAILEDSGKAFNTVLYLKEPLSKDQLVALLQQLNLKPEALVRKTEKIWKTEYSGKDLDENAIIDAMIKHPVLIERPIVSDGTRAVLGRPPENISQLLK